MGLFDKKVCELCGGKAGLLGREKIASGGYICGNCRDKMSRYTRGFSQMTLNDVQEQIRLKEDNDRRYQTEFVTTRRFDVDSRHPIMAVDDQHGQFAILTDAKPDIFLFSEIASYSVDLNTSELSEDERRNQNQGSGLLGGLLQFLTSDDFLRRYPDMPRCPTGRKIIGMHFKIDFGPNRFRAKDMSIDVMPGWSNSQEEAEKGYRCANDMYQCIREYKARLGGYSNYPNNANYSNYPNNSGYSNYPNNSGYSNYPNNSGYSNYPNNANYGPNNAPYGGGASNAAAMDEVRRLKELLDMGAITQQEFEQKKRQLLGL